MQIYWTPEQHRRVDRPASTLRSRLGRFLALSTTAHVLGAAAATSLSLSLLPSRADESLIVRTIDFLEPAPPRPAGMRGNRREANDDPVGVPAAPARVAARATAAPRAGKPSAPAAPATSAKPAAAPEPASPPASAVAAARDSDGGDVPTPAPTPEEARLAAATPKAIGGGATRGPSQPSAAPAALTAAQGDAPVATVALPPALVGSGASHGSGAAGGSGNGVARGSGPGAPGVDLGDPDFTEYFRLIERRVRSAWTFPDSLGGTTQTVKIGFALGPEGSLREARVVSSSSGTLNDSALSAMKRAAPFPPLPEKFRRLAGQPLVMSFTVMIR
jgi:TonB family protein